MTCVEWVEGTTLCLSTRQSLVGHGKYSWAYPWEWMILYSLIHSILTASLHGCLSKFVHSKRKSALSVQSFTSTTLYFAYIQLAPITKFHPVLCPHWKPSFMTVDIVKSSVTLKKRAIQKVIDHWYHISFGRWELTIRLRRWLGPRGVAYC